MHKIRNYIMLAGLVALATNAVAQEDEGPSRYTYATYFYCDVTGQERADEIVKSSQAPVYDKLVAEGKMSSWGWLAHHTGGKWRRLQYHQAPSIEALLLGLAIPLGRWQIPQAPDHDRHQPQGSAQSPG